MFNPTPPLVELSTKDKITLIAIALAIVVIIGSAVFIASYTAEPEILDSGYSNIPF